LSKKISKIRLEDLPSDIIDEKKELKEGNLTNTIS